MTLRVLVAACLTACCVTTPIANASISPDSLPSYSAKLNVRTLVGIGCRSLEAVYRLTNHRADGDSALSPLELASWAVSNNIPCQMGSLEVRGDQTYQPAYTYSEGGVWYEVSYFGPEWGPPAPIFLLRWQ